MHKWMMLATFNVLKKETTLKVASTSDGIDQLSHFFVGDLTKNGLFRLLEDQIQVLCSTTALLAVTEMMNQNLIKYYLLIHIQKSSLISPN